MAQARDHLPKMTALLEEVVRINSHTANKSGVDAAGAVFTRHAFDGEFECAEGLPASEGRTSTPEAYKPPWRELLFTRIGRVAGSGGLRLPASKLCSFLRNLQHNQLK